MSIARALAVLGVGLGGLAQGEEEARQRRRQEEDDAFRREQRDRQRTQWKRDDESYAADQADKEAERNAMAPTEVKPDLAPDQMGPAGFNAGGKTFANPEQADAAAKQYNTPAAGMARAAGVVKNPARAAQLQGQAAQAELTGMQLDQARAEQEAKAWDRKMLDAFIGSPGKLSDPGAMVSFMSESKADGKGGETKWSHKVDGDKLTLFPVGPDGTALNSGFTIPNTLEGRLEFASRLSKATPITAKLADIRAQTKAASEAADREADNKRADAAETRRGVHEDRMYQQALRQSAAADRAASRAGGGAGGGGAPIWDDKADQFLRDRYTVKDPNTGAVGVDGNGMQFSKLLGLAQSQRNGGDTTRALGFAFEKDNELRALATDPKKGYDEARHNQLRQGYLQSLVAQPKPNEPQAPKPAAASPAAVPQPRAGMAGAADPLMGLSRQQARQKRAELETEAKKWIGKPGSEARVAELQSLIARIDNGQY